MKKQDISEEVVKYVYLSIGSNIGDRILNIEKTKHLILNEKIKILCNSSYYETPSWPNPKFPKFLNIVLKINTKLDIKNLFLLLKNIEKIMGRKIGKKNYPRICDIDIIDFKGNVCSMLINNQKIITPHPRMFNRNFVLFPLFEINQNWKHPRNREKISKLLFNLPISSIRAIKVI